MTDSSQFPTLKKFGLQISPDRIKIVRGYNKDQVTLHLANLQSIEFRKAKPTLPQVLLFWMTRILTFNMMTGTSFLGGRLDYRYNYNLIIHTAQKASFKLTIRDFDKFQLGNEIKELNLRITALSNGSKK